jgi:hypothetical protein
MFMGEGRRSESHTSPTKSAESKEISNLFFVSNRRVLLAQVSTRLVLGEQIKATRISYEVNHVEANPVFVFHLSKSDRAT